jgi:tetratricopeptide (TPR) repeat protein
MNRHQRRANSRLRHALRTARAEIVPRSVLLGAAELMQNGIKHHRAGRLAEAEASYRQILLTQSSHADALHLLGVVAHQTGQNDLAVELIDKAIKINGQNAAYFSNLGNALRGKLDEMIAAYRQAILIKPDYADAHSNLGNALREQGKLEEAEAAYRQAIWIKPDLAEAHSNLGTVLFDQGKLDEAEAAYRQAIRIKPGHAKAHSNLGNVLQDLGKLDEAVDAYRRAIKIRPDYAEAHFNHGNALRKQGKIDEAVAACRRAITINPDSAEAHCNLGAAFCDQGDLDQAVVAYRQAVQLKPDYAKVQSDLGVALFNQGKLDEAIAAYHQAIRIKPDNVEAYFNLGKAFYDQGNLDLGVAAYRQVIRIKPEYAEAHSNLGVALYDQGKLDEAAATCRQAITLKPNFADAHANLGLALMQLGKLSEAREALKHAVRLSPSNASYLGDFGKIARFVAGDPHLAAMEQLSRESASLSIDDRIKLHFALAKAYEDVGRHAEAFQQWLDGNTLKRRQVVYDEATTLGEFDRIQAVFTSELMRTWQNVGHASSVPVFIIGMPRSGSTLVEQILASHPQVFGGGELMHFAEAVKAVQTTRAGLAIFREPALSMTGDAYRSLGARYLAEIEHLAPGSTHITDKMPRNFIFAGLIHLALPNAPIIHTVRDPIDTCVSCFSKLFSGEQNYTYDLAELGRYYRHYQALMEHWHHVLPASRILDVRYEDVVADLEGQARRIVAHCRLDWDPRCLAFNETVRPVRTASVAQVRQPIYTSAVGRWRVHEKYLGPLLAELGFAGDSTQNHTVSADHISN